MLTGIVAYSETLCNFLLPLLVTLTVAQQRHILNCIEALLVCPFKHKTLAALTRLLHLPHADEFALADFFRCSPWNPAALQRALTLHLLKTVAHIQANTGWRLLFLSIDDALCPKDAATRVLEAVSHHYDHVQVRRQHGKYTNSSCYVLLHLQLGPVQVPLAWRLYLKRKVVKRLNRQRAGTDQPKLTFCKVATLVEAMLTEIAPDLPPACRVYVLFDSWFDSYHLQRFIRSHGWHWICATKSNRNLSGRPLCQWWAHLAHQRIERVSLRTATRKHTYSTRHLVGCLRRYPDPVVAIISKRHQRDPHPAYFLCSDTSLRVRTILKYYGYRWQTEVDNWYLKECLGLADYRVQSVEATLRWHTVVFAAYAFLHVQRARPLLANPHATLIPVSEVRAQHQRAHVEQILRHIAARVREGCRDQELLTEFLPP
jgi:DDE superfamily endonuclease